MTAFAQSLRGLALAAVLLAHASGPAAAFQTYGSYNTDYGPVTYRFDGGKFEGNYPKHNGRLLGVLDRGGRSVSGTWLQHKSDYPCSTPRHGSYNWGYFRFHETPHGFNGQWSYCDGPMNQVWNGQRSG